MTGKCQLDICCAEKYGRPCHRQVMTHDISEFSLKFRRLFGKSMIDGLQSGRSHLHDKNGKTKVSENVIDAEILKTSLQCGVLSKKTAFVAGDSFEI
jgi:hypothetical protein